MHLPSFRFAAGLVTALATVGTGCATRTVYVIDDRPSTRIAVADEPVMVQQQDARVVTYEDDAGISDPYDFVQPLNPYGDWVQYPGYGLVFVPARSVVGVNFRPYTNGHWEHTEWGWTWVDHHPFGWATGHYGRWFYDTGYGWVWVPGTQWAPAWVSWRDGGGYIGWAAMPPGSIYGGGYSVYETSWVFVSTNNFGASYVGGVLITGGGYRTCYASTRPQRSTVVVYGRNTYRGPDYDDVSRRTRIIHRPIRDIERDRPTTRPPSGTVISRDRDRDGGRDGGRDSGSRSRDRDDGRSSDGNSRDGGTSRPRDDGRVSDGGSRDGGTSRPRDDGRATDGGSRDGGTSRPRDDGSDRNGRDRDDDGRGARAEGYDTPRAVDGGNRPSVDGRDRARPDTGSDGRDGGRDGGRDDAGLDGASRGRDDDGRNTYRPIDPDGAAGRYTPPTRGDDGSSRDGGNDGRDNGRDNGADSRDRDRGYTPPVRPIDRPNTGSGTIGREAPPTKQYAEDPSRFPSAGPDTGRDRSPQARPTPSSPYQRAPTTRPQSPQRPTAPSATRPAPPSRIQQGTPSPRDTPPASSSSSSDEKKKKKSSKDDKKKSSKKKG